MANLLKPARATSPGRVLLRELDARGWSQRDLAAIMGRPYQAINQIARGVKRITPETARELAQAFGTSPELWMNLEVNYRLQLAKQEKKEREIARRSHLYSLAPVAELIRRGQIEGSDDVDELEKQVREYLRAYKQEKAHLSPALPRHS
jgi:HTH-type transcriptional regulator/antitoxin HigA